MSKQNKQQNNAADETEVAEAGKREKTRAARAEDDLKWILSDKRGRRFYWRLLADCGVFKSSMTGNSQTFFNEGMRNIGLKLLADLNDVEPDAYVLMLKESRDDSV